MLLMPVNSDILVVSGGSILLYSSERKKILCGWLLERRPHSFSSTLKMQKFLFFYETMSKAQKDNYEFRKLRGYVNGPVFSDVFGDRFHNYDRFTYEVRETYTKNSESVNEERAAFAAFIVEILNEKELSELTHKFNIWNAKERDINCTGNKNVSLCEEDFSLEDTNLLLSLKKMYSQEYIESIEVKSFDDKNFIISKTDLDRLRKMNNEIENIFISLSNSNELQNPVYISLSDQGVILVD